MFSHANALMIASANVMNEKVVTTDLKLIIIPNINWTVSSLLLAYLSGANLSRVRNLSKVCNMGRIPPNLAQ